MRQIAIFAMLALCPMATAQVQLQFPSTQANYVRVLGGKVYVGSKQVAKYQGLDSTVVQRSSIVLSPPASVALGGNGNDIPLDAKLDPSGNIWIAGTTDSDDFALVNPIVSQKFPYGPAGFVVELDPTGRSILFSTYLCGRQFSDTVASTLAIDSAGNVYVGGTTGELDFPTTTGAFLRSFATSSTYSYAMKISPAGKLIFSTLLNTSPLLSRATASGVSSMAVDANGALTVCGVFVVGYVLRLAPDGSKLLWSNLLGSQWPFVNSVYMAQDVAGNVQVLGSYQPYSASPTPPRQLGTPGLFSAQITADGSQVLNFIDYGQSADSVASGVAIDAGGKAYLAGTSSSAKVSGTTNSPRLGSDFIVSAQILSAAAGTILFRLPHGVVTAPPTIDSAGNLQLLGAQGALLTISPTYSFNTPAIVGFANSASYALNTGLSVGTLVSLFGYDLPANPQILIGGVVAPILFSGPNQINIQVPNAATFAFSPTVTLSPGSFSFNAPFVQSVGIFTVDGTFAAALNQDGTVNSATNPAAIGSIVSLFGTGTTDTAAVASINTFPVNVLYFGPAPGLPNVFQANIQVDAFGFLTIQPHGSSFAGPLSNSVLIYTRQSQ